MLGKLLGAVTGDAGRIEPEALGERFQEAILPGETVLAAFRTIRDGFALTDWRLVLVDRQGLTGSKTELVSIPYRSILRFSLEAGGTLDMDEELKVWDRAGDAPLSFSFRRGGGAAALAHRILSERVRG
ncbi:PH domain-containing protein [Roseomonas sp. SSH11]|uniref:PH domain-containing protein n=1 Tax=Pararoseomonas baculiformis TaxID=2820812 RepID=A0ABS4ABI7_9PROT|nr:PH domain-containing protein [Pararoseomonas baculiformis]MBP0444372.1 PH domain-containing protein [Pararoseomonas baculiformis]